MIYLKKILRGLGFSCRKKEGKGYPSREM